MQKSKKSTVIRLIVCAVLLAALIGIGLATKLISFEGFKNINFHIGILFL